LLITVCCAKGEAEQVQRTFSEEFKINLVYVDAEERFLTRLAGVSDPEEKPEDYRHRVYPGF